MELRTDGRMVAADKMKPQVFLKNLFTLSHLEGFGVSGGTALSAASFLVGAGALDKILIMSGLITGFLVIANIPFISV